MHALQRDVARGYYVCNGTSKLSKRAYVDFSMKAQNFNRTGHDSQNMNSFLRPRIIGLNKN